MVNQIGIEKKSEVRFHYEVAVKVDGPFVSRENMGDSEAEEGRRRKAVDHTKAVPRIRQAVESYGHQAWGERFETVDGPVVWAVVENMVFDRPLRIGVAGD